MPPTLTAADPAVFPDDVRRFAAERGVTEYLVPLYELAKQCFDGAEVTVLQEDDYEEPDLRWVVYAVATDDWDTERYMAAYKRRLTAFHETCPGDARGSFVLGSR